jgi:hypothetical protein
VTMKQLEKFIAIKVSLNICSVNKFVIKETKIMTVRFGLVRFLEAHFTMVVCAKSRNRQYIVSQKGTSILLPIS